MEEEKQEKQETQEEKQDCGVQNAENGERIKKRKPWITWVLTVAIALGAFGAGFFTDRLLLDGELRALLRLKNKIQDSYYQEVTDEQFYNVLFDAVNENLLDDYSKYMTADEYKKSKAEAKGEQSGLGLVFSTKKADGTPQLRVVRVCGNSPAENKGIQAGDFVVGYGKTAETVAKNNIFADFSAFLSDFRMGEKFFVEFENAGIVEIAKAVYVENYVFYRNQEKGYCFTGNEAEKLTERGNGISFLNEDTAYIRLVQFNGGAAEEFKRAMELFKSEKKKHLVLDLRGNGGGYLNILREIASYFCKTATESKPIISIADYGESKEIFRAKGNLYKEFFVEDSRICVLADDGTASASECLLGCMLDYQTISYGDICLSERDGVAKTYGKGIMQTTYPLSIFSGDAVKLTTAKLFWPIAQKSIHGVGILPTDGTKTVRENYQEDEELHSALQVLFP